MVRIAGMLVAAGILWSSASTANAQVSVSIGNPYAGRGVVIGNPGYGYNPFYGYPGYTTPYGYRTAYAAPLTTVYSSGYAGYVAPAPIYAPSVYSYGYSPYVYRGYRYPAYGYGGYRNGRGFRPFR